MTTRAAIPDLALPASGVDDWAGSVRRGDGFGSVGRCRPARQQIEGVMRRSAGLGGIGGDPQAFVRGQIQGLIRQGEVADDRVLKALDAGVVAIESRMRCTLGRTCCRAGRRGGRVAPLAARARSNR